LYARDLGARRLFVLHDDSTYGRGLAQGVKASTELAQMDLAGSAAWHANEHGYRGVAERARRAHADAVYLAGFIDSNSGRLIKDLRRALRSHTQLLGPDGFSDPPSLKQHAGSAAEDFVFTIATLPVDKLPPAGRRFAAEFERRFGASRAASRSRPPRPRTSSSTQSPPPTAHAPDVTRNVLHARVTNGLLGTFRFDAAGDTTGHTIAIYRILGGRGRFQKAIMPPHELLARK
jgi:ABC-type branched-subunit amino acid transport system substrate-binding protein